MWTLRAAEFLPAGAQQKTIFAKCERKAGKGSQDIGRSGDGGKRGEKKEVTLDTDMALQSLFLSWAKYAFKDVYPWKQLVGHKVFLGGMSFEMSLVQFIGLMSHLTYHKSFN